MKKIRLALLGFGNAGQAFARLLTDKKKEIEEAFGYEVFVVAIVTKSRGSLTDPSGIDLEKACEDIRLKGRLNDTLKTIDSLEYAKTEDYDVLIEMTPLEIFSGRPAIDHVRAGLLRGKHVITANKGPIAWACRELRELAQQQNALFYYETTVMDGTPVFNLAEQTLRLCRVTKIEGILNSTTNFVLGGLSRGRDWDSILREGKERGFVEADPSVDIDGWDAAAKTAALMNALMDADITPPEIDRTGIGGITGEDLKEAESRGNTIKLVCRGHWENGMAKGRVAPEEIPRSHIFSCMEETSSVLSLTTDLMGTISIVEHIPEIEQTGYGILSDLLRVLAEMKNGR